MDTLNWVFGIFGILGTFGTFYYGWKSYKLSVQRCRFSWADVVDGSQKISQKCIKRFKPDAILTFSGSGAVIANLALLYSGMHLPIYSVIEFPAMMETSASKLERYIKLRYSKWLLCVPQSLFIHVDKKITVIHDCAVTGVGINLVISELVKLGFKRENIMVASLICTQAAIDAKLSPDFYPYAVDNSMFHFPWGARI